MKKIAYIVIAFCIILSPVSMIFADNLIPNSVLQYIKDNPNATPTEIETFVKNNNPDLFNKFSNKDEMVRIINQGGSNYAFNSGSQFSAQLKDIIRNPNLSYGFIFLSLGLAIVLGALHALTPGHGKTMVAAYLVGTKGRPIDAVLLGLVVTITHTGSVILLGLISIFLSQYILPQTLFPYIGLLSGLLIVLLGTRSLYKRMRPTRLNDVPQPGSIKSLIGQKAVVESHAELSKNIKFWKLRSGSQVSLGNLISLGISGGIIPCPDALVVLLIAISLNKIVFGLAIVLAFSVGLAAVLIIVGLLIVVARPFMDRHAGNNSRIMKYLPILSSVAITIIGLVFVGKAIMSFNL